MGSEAAQNSTSADGASAQTLRHRGPAAELPASGRRRTAVLLSIIIVVAAIGGVALLAAFVVGNEPLEESLDNATFFADQPTTTTVEIDVVSADELATPAEPAWQPLIPDEGVLVATGRPGLATIEVFAAPDPAAGSVWQLPVPTEFGGPRHFQVIGEVEDWVEVKVPVRPNGSTGWIRTADVTFSVTTMRVDVDVSDRAVRVWDGDTLVFETTGAVGRDAYPTPVGEWYLRDVIPWDENSVYGPWVMALSVFSEQIDEINGGQAVVALHGTSRPDQLGSAVSLGCVRLSNDDITTVASLVPVGSPVVVSP